MKNSVKLFAVALLAMVCSAASAQTFKFGHINLQELTLLTPDYDSAMVKLNAYGKSLEEEIQTAQTELQAKYASYQKNLNTWTAAILEQKQREINEMTQRVQEFQQTAETDFRNMQQTLMRPVIEKVNATITKIGKEQGFTYVFDVSTGAIPYFNTDQSTDLMSVLKKALSIPADKKLPVAQPQQ